MRKSIVSILFLSLLLSCNTQPAKDMNKQNSTEMEKKNIGNLLALYPKPMTVVGAEVGGKVNWLVVGHTGIIGHDRILVSMSKSHYTNQGIRKSIEKYAKRIYYYSWYFCCYCSIFCCRTNFLNFCTVKYRKK